MSENLVVGEGGIEPPTSVLSGQRSTTELLTQIFSLYGGQGSGLCSLPTMPNGR